MVRYETILLEHGAGGLLMSELIAGMFLPRFSNVYLDRLEDSAVFSLNGMRLCFTTDSYVVDPIFFPGGNIGSLAVYGTVNDIAVCGGIPLFLSAGFILEEGFDTGSLEKIVDSMAQAAKKAKVHIVTGDTKVVPRGAADRIFINVSGIGVIRYPGTISPTCVMPGDAVIISGTVGDHGAAILCARQDLGIHSHLMSDSAPLNLLIEGILEVCPSIHCMRDVTRGGLGTVLCEIASHSQCRIVIDEGNIPLHGAVRGVCEILGLDPLFLASEGKMVVFCPEEDAGKVLEVMRSHELGRDSAVIGTVVDRGTGRLVMNTVVGGSREIDLPTGELVPRIC